MSSVGFKDFMKGGLVNVMLGSKKRGKEKASAARDEQNARIAALEKDKEAQARGRASMFTTTTNSQLSGTGRSTIFGN